MFIFFFLIKESALKYKSRLNPPSKLIKYTPAQQQQSAIPSSDIPARNPVSFQQQQVEKHLAFSSSKKQSSLQQQQQIKSIQPIPASADSKQIKLIKTGQTATTDSNLKQSNTKYSATKPSSVLVENKSLLKSKYNCSFSINLTALRLTTRISKQINKASIR